MPLFKMGVGVGVGVGVGEMTGVGAAARGGMEVIALAATSFAEVEARSGTTMYLFSSWDPVSSVERAFNSCGGKWSSFAGCSAFCRWA